MLNILSMSRVWARTFTLAVPRLDSSLWLTGHWLMHCSTLLSMFQETLWIDCSRWLDVSRIPESYSPSQSRAFKRTPRGFVSPVRRCQRLLFALRLRRSRTQTVHSSLSQRDRIKYLGSLVFPPLQLFFLFSFSRQPLSPVPLWSRVPGALTHLESRQKRGREKQEEAGKQREQAGGSLRE